MVKILQVRDLPDDVHATLLERAAAAGMSMSEYVRRQLTEVAEQPTLDEIFARAAAHGATFSFSDVIGAIEEGRAER